MRFSVIIPLYNKAPYVRNALESVIGQSFMDFELIVVDDGSSDESYDIAFSVLKTSNIRYQIIHQQNAGVSVARNNGVFASMGDYLCFLDADDWWDPAFLEKMDSLIRSYPDAGIYGTNYYYVKKGRKRICITKAETGYINYCQVYADTLAMPLTSISVSIPRAVFVEMKGFRPNLRFGEDFNLWIRIALKYKVAFLKEPLAFYFQDSNPEWRGIGHLVDPKYHMLWSLGDLSEYEIVNPDYKHLVDILRTSALLQYHLSKKYRPFAAVELKKVDWSLQSKRVQRLYRMPIFVLIIRRELLFWGSKAKQLLMKLGIL